MKYPRVFVAGLLGFFAFSLAPAAWPQCPAKTTIADTLFNADGTLAAGRVVIAWPTFQIGACQTIAGQISVAVNNGAFSVELYPNDAAVPPGTSYRVTYYLKSGRITTEYWAVPSSSLPVNLAAVRSSSVPVPTVMFSQAQVTNLLSDLSRKVELPYLCPAGKFLQTNGSSAPPQVSCVDGTGAPLASTTQSGTVRIDVTESDPLVYTKATSDSLLAAKAEAAHTHSAADTNSGVFDPARLPTPSPTALGGVRSGLCSGTDKVTGISTVGTITCGADQTGGGAGSQHQVNAANLAANDPVNFQDSATISFANPSAGNVQASVKDASMTADKLSVANPSGAQLSGLGDANISTGALSPNRISGVAEVQANKGAASGYASLDGSSKVVQDPANAQTTAGASKIPLADGAGKIADGWLSSSVTMLGQTIELDGTEVTNTLPPSKGGAGANNTATTGRYLRGNGTSFVTSSGAASGTGSCTNQFVRALNDDAAPTCATVSTTDVAAALRTFTSSISLLSPATGDANLIQVQFPVASTITRVSCSIDTGTSVTINLDKRTESTPNTAGTNVLSAGLVCDTNSQTSCASGCDVNTISSGGVSARQLVNLQITGISGTPGVLRLHVEYTKD